MVKIFSSKVEAECPSSSSPSSPISPKSSPKIEEHSKEISKPTNYVQLESEKQSTITLYQQSQTEVSNNQKSTVNSKQYELKKKLLKVINIINLICKILQMSVSVRKIIALMLNPRLKLLHDLALRFLKNVI